MQHFGHWVRSIRESKKMTATECGKLSGMTVSGWSNMERLTASPKTETVRKVAQVFDMTSEEVMLQAGLTTTHHSPDEDLSLALSAITMKLPEADRQRFRRTLRATAEAIASGYVVAA